MEGNLRTKGILKEGGYFGDRSLVYKCPMDSTAKAITHVDIFTISQRDFEEVLVDHPTVQSTIKELADYVYTTAPCS